jgi:hypothetical protein
MFSSLPVWSPVTYEINSSLSLDRVKIVNEGQPPRVEEGHVWEALNCTDSWLSLQVWSAVLTSRVSWNILLHYMI